MTKTEFTEFMDWAKEQTIIKGSTISKEDKIGKWIMEYDGNGWNDYWNYTCSNCGKKYERADNVLYKSNFCPNCGARIEGEEDA